MNAQFFPQLRYSHLVPVNHELQPHKGFMGSFTAWPCYSDRFLAQGVASPEPQVSLIFRPWTSGFTAWKSHGTESASAGAWHRRSGPEFWYWQWDALC